MKAIVLIFGLILLFGCVTVPTQPAGEQEAVTGAETAEEIPEEPVVVTIPVEEEEEEEEPPVVEEEEDPLELINHKEMTFDATDGWKIYGTVYYATSDTPKILIMLIPMKEQDRSSYDELVPLLHDAIPSADVVALDMRGQGKSTNLGIHDNFQTGDFRAMKNDLKAVRSYYSVGRPSVDTIYLVGASIGSSAAIDYAEETGEVAKVVMLSPGISYSGFDIEDYVELYLHELYIVSASEDSYSANSANQIYYLSPSDTRELKLYYGTSAHGTDLFDATEDSADPLLEKTVNWLK